MSDRAMAKASLGLAFVVFIICATTLVIKGLMGIAVWIAIVIILFVMLYIASIK